MSVDDSVLRTWRGNPGASSAYTGVVMIAKFDELRNPEPCILVDLRGATARGSEILDWYGRSYFVDTTGLGVIRMPRVVDYIYK